MNNDSSVPDAQDCVRKLNRITLSPEESGGLIFLSVVNGLFACPTFLANLLVLLTIWLKPALRCNSINLLGVLAVTDLLVGLLVQPLFVAYSAHIVRHGVEGCFAYVPYDLLSFFTGFASATTALLVSLDRCISVLYPLRYEDLVTTSRLLMVTAVTWSAWALFISGRLYSGIHGGTFAAVRSTTFLLSIVVIVLVYGKMVLVSRKHEREIAAQQVHVTENQRSVVHKNSKALKTAVYVVGTFLVCYLPLAICLGYFPLVKRSRSERFMPKMATITLSFVNSLLNPIIYWWRVPHMRRAILQLLRIRKWEDNELSIPDNIRGL